MHRAAMGSVVSHVLIQSRSAVIASLIYDFVARFPNHMDENGNEDIESSSDDSQSVHKFICVI